MENAACSSFTAVVFALPADTEGFASDSPPPHNKGYLASRGGQSASRNAILIGNCTCLTLKYCFMVNVHVAEGPKSSVGR